MIRFKDIPDYQERSSNLYGRLTVVEGSLDDLFKLTDEESVLVYLNASLDLLSAAHRLHTHLLDTYVEVTE